MQEHYPEDFDLLGKVKVKGISYEKARGIAVANWIGRRKATRLTPIFLVLLFVLGVPLAFWGTPSSIVAIGAGLAIVVYAANRHVREAAEHARQWAFRMSMLPVAGTGWVIAWHAMHQAGRDVLNERMMIAYWLFGCLAWAWLHTSRVVGTRIGWERLQADFSPTARAAGLKGALVKTKVVTKHGHKRLLDVRGTGRRASEIATSAELAEQLAAAEGLPAGAVRLEADPAHAGFVQITTYTSNPWEHPIPHPRAPGFATTPGKASPKITDPFAIGKDPDTDEPLLFRLANEEGGVHTLIIAGTGGGKTNLINNIVEHLTRITDEQGRPVVEITMIDMLKGHKDAANWGPAVHRVYPGPESVNGAIGALRRAAEEIPIRARLNGQRARSKHVPTFEEPAKVIIIDEASSLLNKSSQTGRTAAGHVQRIFQGGRSEMIILILAGQRAVNEHLGTSDGKANAFCKVVLPVAKESEMTLAVPNWRERGMPNMATYGRGAKGVVLIDFGTKWQAGRTYELHDMLTVRRIAQSRVLPEHAAAMGGRSPSGQGSSGPAAIPDLVTEPPLDGVDDPDTEGRTDAVHPSGRTPDGAGPDAGGRPDGEEPGETGPVRPDVPDLDLDDPTIRLTGAVVDMAVSMDRMRAVTGHYAAREAARTPAERERLVRAWRAHTVRTDLATKLPEIVVRTVRDLAIAAGPDGFTREDVRATLVRAGWDRAGKETINRHLRVLVSQGYLERLARAAPGRGGRDLYRLATKGTDHSE